MRRWSTFPSREMADPVLLVGRASTTSRCWAEVGRGGMGVVFKARQKSLDRLVAIKFLQAGLRTTPPSGPASSPRPCPPALAHPNIPTVYQAGECPAGPDCAMEFIEGQTLDALIRGRTVSIASAGGPGLPHRRGGPPRPRKGIIHRDLKPANIMLDRSHRPVVMDFGLARMLEKPTSLTHEGQNRRHADVHAARTGPRQPRPDRPGQRRLLPRRHPLTACWPAGRPTTSAGTPWRRCCG